MNKLNVTGRTKVNRLPKRASYDKNVIYKILDSTFVCHIAFKIDGHVYIIPTIYGRKDDYILVHGSKNSRMLKSFEKGEDVSISVTLVDGIVLARSAFHHSINYRSVIIFGKPKITMMLEKYSFSPGENAKGTISLNLKKPTYARKLQVSLNLKNCP